MPLRWTRRLLLVFASVGLWAFYSQTALALLDGRFAEAGVPFATAMAIELALPALLPTRY